MLIQILLNIYLVTMLILYCYSFILWNITLFNSKNNKFIEI